MTYMSIYTIFICIIYEYIYIFIYLYLEGLKGRIFKEICNINKIFFLIFFIFFKILILNF